MFYKIVTPKYLEAANEGALLENVFLNKNTFSYTAPALAVSQFFAKFTGKHLCESVYFIKFQHVSM